MTRTVRFRLLFALFLLATWPPRSAVAAGDPVVTFYSSGSIMTTGLPGSRHGIYRGYIFDGQQRLALLRRNNFVTIRFAAGEHIFSASLSGKHPAGNSRLSLTLDEGKSYFIRVQSESSGAFVVEFEKGRLDVITCEAAHAELTQAKPTSSKDISVEILDRVLPETTLPECH